MRTTIPGPALPFIPVVIPSETAWDIWLPSDKSMATYRIHGPRRVAEKFAAGIRGVRIAPVKGAQP